LWLDRAGRIADRVVASALARNGFEAATSMPTSTVLDTPVANPDARFATSAVGRESTTGTILTGGYFSAWRTVTVDQARESADKVIVATGMRPFLAMADGSQRYTRDSHPWQTKVCLDED